jgi:ATP-dependent Lon protease
MIYEFNTQQLSPWQRWSHTLLRRDQVVCVAALRDPSSTTRNAEDVFQVGCAVLIQEIKRLEGPVRRVRVHGLCRVRIAQGLAKSNRYQQVRVQKLVEKGDTEVGSSVERLKQLAQRLFPLSNIFESMQKVQDGGKLADVIAAYADLEVWQQQTILEATDVRERIARMIELLESIAGGLRR